MRKITRNAVNAMVNSLGFKCGNTQVVQGNPNFCEGIVTMYLHGNPIATLDKPFRTLIISNCGYPTRTTSERLTGLLRELDLGYTYIHKGTMYYAGPDLIELSEGTTINIDIDTGYAMVA